MSAFSPRRVAVAAALAFAHPAWAQDAAPAHAGAERAGTACG